MHVVSMSVRDIYEALQGLFHLRRIDQMIIIQFNRGNMGGYSQASPWLREKTNTWNPGLL